MALIAWSSFQYESKGWTLSNCTRTAGVGQSGLAGIYATVGTLAEAQYNFSSRSEIITGFCWKHPNVSGQRLFSDVSFGNFNLSIGTDGSIKAYRGGWSSTLLGTSASGIITDNVEHYIEIRVLASTSVGEVEVRLNGDPTPVLNLGPMNVGIGEWVSVNIVLGASGARMFSAWYLEDTTGGSFDDFLGHIRYGILDPNGNGANSDFNGSDGNQTDNYLLVDDGFSHDSDTTYVQADTVGNKDTYAVGSLPTTPLSIQFVSPVFIAKKTDAGTRGITPVIRSGGTDYLGATEHFMSTSYDSYKQAVATDPDTATAWDEAGIDAMEIGVEVTT